MSKPKSRPELVQTDLVEELPAACATEAAAVAFLEGQRWPGGACCPTCGSTNVYAMRDRAGERSKRFLWRCREKECGKMFTVRTGTVYAESLIPLHKWLRALWETSADKNGINALELSRKVQITYKSALFLLHRIRHAMTDTNGPAPKLSGTVEADETYVGGKPRPHERGWAKDRLIQPRDKWTKKTPVFAVVQRGGDVRAKVMPTVTAANLADALIDNVEPTARLMTDDNYKYRRVGRTFPGGHEAVNHSLGEYVRGDVHTNTIEGFFSRIKRKINGTHHAVSKRHLHRYVAEAAFIYNTRGLNDGQRIQRVIKEAEGKRLMYREPVKRPKSA